MRTTRTIVASLCAVLGLAALAGPAAAGQQGAEKADVYVPPAALYTAAPADHTATANVYVPQAALSSATPYKSQASAPPIAKPITRHAPATSGASSGFDWGSAAIGAASIVGVLLIGLGGAAEVRRRRRIQPAAIA